MISLKKCIKSVNEIIHDIIINVPLYMETILQNKCFCVLFLKYTNSLTMHD